jgi:hypothetical protein
LSAIVTATVLTVSPVFVYGAEGFGNLLKTFWRLSNSGWPVRGNNQSLIAAIDRYTSGFAAEGVRVAPDAPLAAMLYFICAILLVLAMIHFVRARPTQSGVPCEVAAVTTLAVLLSPIAWDHYWTLMFPAFFVLYEYRATTVFWIAAVLTTGLSPLTLGRTGFDLARQLSASTIAALIVYVALVRIGRRVSETGRVSTT